MLLYVWAGIYVRFYGCESTELNHNTLACLQAVPVENLILNTTNRGFQTPAGERSQIALLLFSQKRIFKILDFLHNPNNAMTEEKTVQIKQIME
jgi:hypothetical protein